MALAANMLNGKHVAANPSLALELLVLDVGSADGVGVVTAASTLPCMCILTFLEFHMG
jgi:hypothetical protein